MGDMGGGGGQKSQKVRDVLCERPLFPLLFNPTNFNTEFKIELIFAPPKNLCNSPFKNGQSCRNFMGHLTLT